MPTISIFYGIFIRMYYDEHSPPHFHAYYEDFEIMIAIKTLEVLKGSFPPRALGMVVEWAFQYRKELQHNWDLAEKHFPLNKIKPLG
jgi:hypothetical protein